jgi:hypothetical protein
MGLCEIAYSVWKETSEDLSHMLSQYLNWDQKQDLERIEAILPGDLCT